MNIYLMSSGDPSVGSPGNCVTIDWPGLEAWIDDDDDGTTRNNLRIELVELFGEWLDGGPTVVFGDTPVDQGDVYVKLGALRNSTVIRGEVVEADFVREPGKTLVTIALPAEIPIPAGPCYLRFQGTAAATPRVDRGFCWHCGASVPPLEGEGTCEHCEPSKEGGRGPGRAGRRRGEGTDAAPE